MLLVGLSLPLAISVLMKFCRDFAGNAMLLLLGVFPKMLAGKGFTGREKVVAAFKDYFASHASDNGSPLLKARFENLVDEIDLEDIARLECVNGLAILLNSVPSAFWTIVYIFGNAALLRGVRDLAKNAVVPDLQGGEQSRTISLTRLREAPQFQSIIQESIRLRTTGVGPRLVREDIVLQNRYLLKKGSYVMIPNHEIHFDSDIWGPSVNNFDEQRFLKSANTRKVPSTAFRGFGGGATLCPGKYFAMAEITAFVAMIVLCYDIRPLEGEWLDLEQDVTDMSLQLGSPKGQFAVEIIPRKDTLDHGWSFVA